MNCRIALLCLSFAGCAHAPTGGDATILSAGAVEPGLVAALTQFEKETGKRAAVSFNTAPQVRERIAKGERFDIVIVPPAVMDAFAKEGRVGSERVMLGSVGQGIAVRGGAPVPDVSSVEAMKRALLAADAVVFNRATGGQYIESMLKKIGVYGDIERKTVRYDSAAQVMEHLIKSERRDIGFGPLPEITIVHEEGRALGRAAAGRGAAAQRLCGVSDARCRKWRARHGTTALPRHAASQSRARCRWRRIAETTGLAKRRLPRTCQRPSPGRRRCGARGST